MPESFFRKYESADLTKRVMGISGTVGKVASVAVTGCISLISMLIYFIRMYAYSSRLSFIGLALVIGYGTIYYFINKLTVKQTEVFAKLDAEAGSKLFQFISGISKIRIAGVENRAIYEYIKPFIKLRERSSKAGKISLINNAVASAATTVFTVVFYILVVTQNESMPYSITVGAFAAFMSLFGAFESNALNIVSQIVSLRVLGPQYKRFEPIMKEKPEYDDGCELPGEITGSIEVNNVSFSYSEDEPNVLTDINLSVNPGDYIGIVGPSGSGKSTLMKLLLGFEKPTSGKIYFDNKDIEKVDKRELRKKMGVVLQNGKLISGSIFDNITITAPNATADDVNRVIEAVGLKNDIEKMPMGIYTMLNEESNTISGGQQQRILIARAIISSPEILIFDEATSALDNITQSMVSETLDKMNVTRIVIAHRLSTIMNCGRILVIDNGKIAEDGSYNELMAKQGIFYSLAIRQTS
ncbi:MAG: ATP-binding cassette domain-containing protein [Clostridia bacterium]|nr:ATP-binding cassette domain-containing protein [Clostridia bacterium]